MKKLLSILVVTLCGIGTMFAQSYIKFKVQLATGSENMGYVTTSSSNTVSNDYTKTSDSYSSTSTKCTYKWGLFFHQSHGNKPSQGYAFARTSDASKYHFVGWSKTNNVNEIISTDFCHGPIGDLTKDLYYCQKITDDNGTFYAHFAENEVWDFIFNPVTEGGQYTVNYTSNNVPLSATLMTTSAALTLSGITNADEASFTLAATASANYRFLRWCFEYSDGTIEYDNHVNLTKKFAKSATISCEFVGKEYAQFVVKGENNSYIYLSDAIAAAKASASKVVVVKESGKLYSETESTPYYDVSTKTYTIPQDITLLVPGDADYTLPGHGLSQSDLSSSGSGAYKRLTIIDDVDFTINGTLSVYAKVHPTTIGTPVSFGVLELGNNCDITINGGGTLNVLGFVAGDPNNSSITVKKDAKVYECMQIKDWRGGTVALSMNNNSEKVFIVNQYYVQSIETKLIVEYGAVEYITTSIAVSLAGDVPILAPFIVPQGGEYSYTSGFFRLKNNAKFIKYYEEDFDRLKFEIIRQDESLSAEAELSHLELSLSSYTINSSKFVMPLNNNMDITIDGVDVTVKYDIAMLAGSTLTIEEDATVTSEGKIYVYDAKQHEVQWTDASVQKGDEGITQLVQNSWYNYFGSGNTSLALVSRKHKNLVYDRSSKDLITSEHGKKIMKDDAKIVVNGKLQGAIYTTIGGASIISETNGEVTFANLATNQKTYQYLQYSYKKKKLLSSEYETKNEAQPVSVPLHPSATLLNADGTYSAGQAASTENNKTYTYYPLWNNGVGKPKGKWSDVLPEGEITPAKLNGNNVLVTIPVVKTGVITFEPQSGDTQINGVDDTKTTFSGTRFASNGAVTFTNGVVTIPIQYTPTTTHDDNITDAAPETVTVTFNCHNIVSNKDEVVTLTINLTATQNYAPDFLINNKADETINLNFPTTVVEQTSAEEVIVVRPIPENVTDRNYNDGKGFVTWTPVTLTAESPFEITGDYFTGAKVVYKPTTTAGTHTRTLTLKATYSDGVEMTKNIVLTGTPQIKQNPLQFVGESVEIYPGDEIESLFQNMGNDTDITITFTINGEETNSNDIIELIPNNSNYKLRVKSGVNIVEQQIITIKATQSANEITTDGMDEIEVTVTPSVQWNWSKLYFGTIYDNPIVVQNMDDPWSLTYNNDCAAIPAANFTGDAVNGYYIEVGTGNECTATFTFTQGSYSLTLSAAVYADPRVLDICMRDANARRTFEDVSVEKTNVRFENGILFATTEQSGAAWTMEVIGIPDKMEFTPQGEGKRWTIMEYDGTNWNTTHTEAEISLAAGQSYYVHNLKASTQQIRVICSQGATSGKIINLCVYALDASASADMDKLYMPIVKDENGATNQSQKSVVLSYVSPSSPLKLSVVDGSGNVVADVTLSGDNLSATHQLPETDVNNLYREETIVVSSTHATEGTVYLLVQDEDNKEMLKLPIRLYEYPQPLPIRTADWMNNNAEKYYFYTDFEHSQNVQFNVVTQKLTFASTGSNQRFITFVFRGGPSYISFESSLAFVPQDDVTAEQLVLQEWYGYWTLEVTDGESPRLIANNAEAEVQPEIVAEVRDGRTYFQIRVAIPYTTKSLTLQSKRALAVEVENLVIDGEPDLDVVLGNHTIEHEAEVNFTPDVPDGEVVVTAINLEQLKVACNNSHFTVTYNTHNIVANPTTLTSADCPTALGNYMVGNISLHVAWDRMNVVEEGLLIFTDKNGQELATIRLLGAKDYILKGNSQNTGLFTGFAENITKHPYEKEKSKYQYARRQVNLSNTFDKNGVALFDYLIVYGETTAEDLGTTILSANTTRGSNAHTPMYVYRKVANNEGVYDRYQFVFDQANVNQGQKPLLHTVVDAEGQQLIPHAKETDGTQYFDIAEGEQLRVYMTGFCPYASTGFDKTQEGVWLFRAKKNAKLDIYLEDCHIYSRNKTRDGHAFTGKKDPGADIFQELYARGSGAVLVFENNDNKEYDAEKAFQVTVHTRGNNLLKSSHGCFYEFIGVRAYQVSSPIQIRMTSDQFYVQNSKTHLTFDDKWPNDVTNYKLADRTNGFLSLQKLNNNAPSIDMGNGNTVVNFRGGQVELQNAQNVSDKYKTTLAISYRSGIMATGGVELQMAHGLGTDAATLGTVNFYDGTISVIKMYVDPEDRKYYLMDPQILDGDTVKDANGNVVLSDSTSCLRCPQNTYVYGGSICMLRTCMSPTSQGGAPTDGVSPLGRFFYKEEYGYEYNTQDKQKPANNDDASQWLVNPVKFPSDITLFEGLADYHTNTGKYTYGIESVTPNEDGQLVFWIPDGFGGVKAEQDRYLTAWKACMPEITAILTQVGTTVVGGTVGGPTGVANIEDVDNLLYCDMDKHIYDVISATTGEGENMRYVYEAPLKVPEGFQMDGIDLGIGDYLRLAPSNVGSINEHKVTNEEDYNINSKVYYVSSATADIWQTFTAPFDVERIWVVETYDENALARTQLTEEDVQNGLNKRQKILTVQANHNADFAAFFGVAMALGSEKSFDEIFDEYMEWAMIEDKHEGTLDTYTKRGRMELQAYDGTNWADAHFYMYHNTGNWTINDAANGVFNTKWEYVKKEGNVLLKRGETYSMLFPYCTGCWDEGGEATREYWDYWSGKLIIFESTQASKDHPHVLRGSNYVAATRPAKGDWIFANDEVLNEYPEVVVTGNSSLAHMTTNRTDVFIYTPSVNKEAFYPLSEDDDEQVIFPSTAFLYGYVPKNNQGMPARGVKRTGEIIYGKDNTATDVNPGGNIPTVGGGNDLFITSTATGINIAVAEPQQVRVLSSTGAVLFSGMVQTAVDVFLPTAGVYVITGENEVHKILH